MPWDRFFAELQDQDVPETQPDHVTAAREAERGRFSSMPMVDRLAALGVEKRPASFGLVDGTTVAGRICAVGADWVALSGEGERHALWIVPLESLSAIGAAQDDLRDSVRRAMPRGPIRHRVHFCRVARDLARRRVPVTVQILGGRLLTGTIDRAGGDHLDLALHDAATPRRAGAVQGHRLVRLSAVVWLRPDGRAPAS